MNDVIDEQLLVIQKEKDDALGWRKRRHDDWNDNYLLYRDKILTNRITQRQSINIPLMKYAVLTNLKNLDNTPSMYFKNNDNKHQEEVFYNAVWEKYAKTNKLEIIDTVDKKQGLLFGRTFKKINIVNGCIKYEVIDPQDMLVHRFVDPTNLHTSPCTIQTGIFKPLREILENENYDKSAKTKLKNFIEEEAGALESEMVTEAAIDKAARMQHMGVEDVFNPILGETYVELNEVYRYEPSELVPEETVVWLYVVASTKSGGLFKLFRKELHQIIGATEDNFWYNHVPFSTWGADPERTDFWSDGPADIIRPISKAVNTLVSQYLENRTLANFNMHYYDSTDPTFIPQTYVPQPWGWYPVGGNPREKIMTVNVPELSNSLAEITWMLELAEKATAATATQTGTVQGNQVTLGEIQLALANAQERIKSVEKYINESWGDFGMLYSKMIEASYDKLDRVKLQKLGRLGKKMYTKEVDLSDTLTRSGYSVVVKPFADVVKEQAEQLQKLDIALASMPSNAPLREIKNKKTLEFAGLSQQEIEAVLEYETQAEIEMKMEEETNAVATPGELPEVPDIELPQV